MNWFYEYNGEQRGPVPEDELDRLLAQGMILPTTLVWRDGLPQWTPLAQARPASASAGVSAVAPGVAQCESCGRFFDAADLVPIAGRQVCAGCKPAMLQSLQQGTYYGETSDPNRTGPAWEQRETLGFLRAARDTIKAVLLRPSETFATMRTAGDLTSPFLFVLIFGGSGYMLSLIYITIAEQIAGTYKIPFGPGQTPALAGMVGFIFVMRIIMAFVAAAGGPFIVSGILHVSLMLFGGARRSYEATYRAVAYSAGSVAMLNLIPLLGSLIAAPWLIVIYCIALAKAHETDLWRAVMAVVLPMFLCCLLCGGFFAIFYFAAMKTLPGH